MLLYVLSAICGVLLFVGGPDYYSPRSHQAGWNLGHDVTFFLWTLLLIRSSPAFAKRSLGQQLFLSVVITVPLGFLIEWLQEFVGRTFSVEDVARDVNGSVLAIAFLSPTGMALRASILGTVRAAALALLLAQLYPVVTAVTDEIIATRQFPVLSSFETPFEISRWSSPWPMKVDQRVAREGRASLRVHLMPAKYSIVSLQYFPSNWHGYSSLHFSVFNASETPLRITCRIHDQQHIASGEPYSDRYHGHFLLAPGWTDVEISLETIRMAPKTRVMDLQHIKDFSVFVTDLKTPETIYLDDVRLM